MIRLLTTAGSTSIAARHAVWRAAPAADAFRRLLERSLSCRSAAVNAAATADHASSPPKLRYVRLASTRVAAEANASSSEAEAITKGDAHHAMVHGAWSPSAGWWCLYRRTCRISSQGCVRVPQNRLQRLAQHCELSGVHVLHTAGFARSEHAHSSLRCGSAQGQKQRPPSRRP